MDREGGSTPEIIIYRDLSSKNASHSVQKPKVLVSKVRFARYAHQ